MGANLLSPERREPLAKLKDEFSFKQAKAALGRSADPTNKFLAECRQLGLIKRVARGRYRKVPQDATPSVDSVGIQGGV